MSKEETKHCTNHLTVTVVFDNEIIAESSLEINKENKI